MTLAISVQKNIFQAPRSEELDRPFANSPLKDIFETAIADRENLSQCVTQLAETYSLEQIQEEVRNEFPFHQNALHTAKELLHEAKYYLETAQDLPPSTRTRISSLLDSMIAVLESFLNAFGIAVFFKPADNEIHSEFKGQKIMMLVSLFTLLSGVLMPVLGPALCGSVLGGIFLATSALSLIYPHFRPAPTSLPHADNWSKECRIGHLAFPEGRKASLDEIAATLIASKNSHTHALLLGKTGVGKTETIKAFVHALERGDYPELKGKQVFYINTANLVNSADMFSGSNRILARISEALGRHRDQFILVLDEIHLACQKKKKTGIGDQLKTLLDSGKKGFPYVIGITTEEEFYRDIYLDHAAFARRFKQITIQNTEDSETLKILNHFLIKKAPTILLAPNAIQNLLNKTKSAFGEQAAQPGTSLKILSQCLKKTGPSEKPPLQIQIEQIRNRIQAIYSQSAAASLLPYTQENETAAKWEKEIQNLEKLLKKEQTDIDYLIALQSELALTKTSAFQTALEASDFARNLLPKQKKKLKEFLLQTHFLAPALEKTILSQGASLGIPVQINDTLIDQVIEEELANTSKVKEMIEQGKQQLAHRKKA